MTLNTYEDHMKQVDVILTKYTGMTHSDFSDFCSYDSWEDHSTPVDTAIDCLEAQDEQHLIAHVLEELYNIQGH